MKKLLQILVLILPVTAGAAPLPVRIEIGDAVFTAQAGVNVRRDLRTLSTPPFTLQMQAPDIADFAAFTQMRVGQEMRVYVCDEVVFSPTLLKPVENGEIYIHTAMLNGRLEAFSTQGCP